MTQMIAAGVDVGRDWLDVAIEPIGHSFRAPNLAQGVAVVVDRLRRLGVRRVVVEAIGVYAARLTRALADAGFEVGIVDPKRVKALRLAEGGKAKTDRLDARLIARFGLIMKDAVRPLPSAEALALRALSSRRRQLVEMIAMEKTRLKQALDPEIAQSHRDAIAHLETQRETMENKIRDAVQAAPEGRRREALLETIPGVGPVTARTLIVDLPELGALDRKAVASLAGLAPHTSQSGVAPAKAQIKGGRSCVRAALYMAALNGVRLEKGFKREYLAMRAAGKPGKVALIAIARKILVAANAMIKEDRPWTPPEPTSGTE